MEIRENWARAKRARDSSIYIYIYIKLSTRVQVSGGVQSSSRRRTTLQNRCLKFDAFPDGFLIALGSILAAQMTPKSRPRGGPDTLSHAYQWKIQKKRVHASFLLALSTLRSCNLTVKTEVFLKILTSSLLSLLLIILAHEGLKNSQKLVSKTSQNQSKTLFDISCVLGALPWRLWNDFGLPNSLPKEVLEASSRPSKTSSFQLGFPGCFQNGFWRPFGPFGARVWIIFGDNFSFKIKS